MASQLHCQSPTLQNILTSPDTATAGSGLSRKIVKQVVDQSLTILKTNVYSRRRCHKVYTLQNYSKNSSRSLGNDSNDKLGESISIKGIRLLSPRSIGSNASSSQHSLPASDRHIPPQHTALLNRLFHPEGGTRNPVYRGILKRLVVNASQQAYSRQSYFAGSVDPEQPISKTREASQNLFLKKQCSSIIETIRQQEDAHRQKMKESESAITALKEQVNRLRKELTQTGTRNMPSPASSTSNPAEFRRKKDTTTKQAEHMAFFHEYFSCNPSPKFSSKFKERTFKGYGEEKTFKKKERRPTRSGFQLSRSSDCRLIM